MILFRFSILTLAKECFFIAMALANGLRGSKRKALAKIFFNWAKAQFISFILSVC